MEAGGFIYDTHAAVRRLTNAGFTERQAEAIAGENLRFIGHNFATRGDIEASQAATKGDIEASQAATKGDIEASRAETKADIATAKTSIILWVAGLVAGLNATMLGTALVSMAWIVDTLLKAQ